MNIPEDIKEIARKIKAADGRLFIVGGAVRDKIMGLEPVDMDFVIEGIGKGQAKEIIADFATVIKDVISNAPVFMARINDTDFEFAMCRKEVDIAPGKAGFEFFSDPAISIFDDLLRRDFTCNAIAEDVLTGERIDPFGGVKDIEAGIIRHVSPAFSQSPERVLRGASFAARLQFTVHRDTITIMRTMRSDFDTIPAEQMWRHFHKAISKSVFPSIFVSVLEDAGWNVFFRIEATGFEIDSPAPEGCDRESWVFSRLISGMSHAWRDKFFDMVCVPNNVRVAAIEFEWWDGKKPEAFVMGRDIISFVKPGPEVGRLLAAAFDAQISGVVQNKEEGIRFIKEIMGS